MMSLGWAWIISIIATMVIADRKKLNIFVYFILSLFLGPCALLIVAVSPARLNKSAETLKETSSHTDLRQELENLKATLRLVQERIVRLESALNGASSEGGVEPPVQSEIQSKVPYSDIVSNHASRDSVVPPRVVPARPEGFEFVFGQYWLSRIGVVLFVFGIGLFINYTFHYFSPLVKIAIGYFFAILFLVWGEKLAKNPKLERLSWGILGGAWGLFYLVTYAMYYLPATRVINSSAVESVLLWIVTVCAVGYNLKYRSWIVTAMTYLFGFITLSIAGLDSTSVFFWCLLLVSLAYLSCIFAWNELLIVGLAGAYAMYLGVLRPQLTPYGHDPVSTFPIAFGLLTSAWIIFFVTILWKEWKEPKVSMISLQGMLSNTTAFVILGLREINYFKGSDENFEFWFLVSIALAHCLAAVVCRAVQKSSLIVAHCALAIALSSLAIVVRFDGLSVSFWWIIEMVALFVLGVHYKQGLYRCMGWFIGLGVLFRFWMVDLSSSRVYAFGIEHDLSIALLAAGAYFMLGQWAHVLEVSEVLKKEEKDFYYYSFPIAGTLVLVSLLADQSAMRWLTLHWTLLGAGLLLLGFLIKNRAFRFSALGVLVIACVRIFAYDLAGADTIYKIIVVIILGAVLLGISFVYAKVKEGQKVGGSS